MRGKKVKALKREARVIAKDQPTKLMGRVQKWAADKVQGMVPSRVQAVNVGYRAVCQNLKKEYKA